MACIAEALGNHPLHIKGEPFFGPSRHKMQLAPHTPQKFLAMMKELLFLKAENTNLDEIIDVLDAIDIFRDPEQRVEIT